MNLKSKWFSRIRKGDFIPWDTNQLVLKDEVGYALHSRFLRQVPLQMCFVAFFEVLPEIKSHSLLKNHIHCYKITFIVKKSNSLLKHHIHCYNITFIVKKSHSLLKNNLTKGSLYFNYTKLPSVTFAKHGQPTVRGPNPAHEEFLMSSPVNWWSFDNFGTSH